jgi:hypothetical protein
MLAHIPLPLAAFEVNEDGRLTTGLRLGRLRSQVAVIRALADHVEHLARPGDTEGLGEQLIEEMTRLACRLLEVAGSLAGSPRSEDRGVFARRPSPGSAD